MVLYGVSCPGLGFCCLSANDGAAAHAGLLKSPSTVIALTVVPIVMDGTLPTQSAHAPKPHMNKIRAARVVGGGILSRFMVAEAIVEHPSRDHKGTATLSAQRKVL